MGDMLQHSIETKKFRERRAKAELLAILDLLTGFVMVCDKCQAKLGKVITPDPWKSGARNTLEGGGRKVNENKLLSGRQARFNPMATKYERCRLCKQSVHQAGSHYCQACAYKKGICAMCGVKILDTSRYAQSSA